MKRAYSGKIIFGIVIAFISISMSACAPVSLKDYAFASYKSKSAEIRSWNKTSGMYLGGGNTLVSNSSPTYFNNASNLTYSIEAKSNNQPVVQAWRELSKGNHLVPTYRYVIKPITGITAEEFISLGAYLQMSRGYPAKMPTEATNGIVITDWHISYNGQIDELTAERIAWLKKNAEEERKRYKIASLELTNNPRVVPVFGERAVQRQSQIDAKHRSLSGEITAAIDYDIQYNQFIESEYLPYTYSYWAKKQGCPSGYLEANWSMNDRIGNAEAVISENSEYIDCHSAALQSYDGESYIEKFPSLSTRAAALWAGSSKTHEISSIRTPKTMLQSPVYALESAVNHLRQAIENIELAGRLAARNAQLEAYSKRNWANTLNSINQRNKQILRQTKPVVYPKNRPKRYVSKDRSERGHGLISQGGSSGSPNNANMVKAAPADTKLNDQSVHSENNKEGNTKATLASANENRADENSGATKANTNDAGDRFVDFRKLNQPKNQSMAGNQQSRPSTNDADSSASSVKSVQPEVQPETRQEPNQYVGAGRDYPFTATSGQYYNLELAVDLAKTALENDASEFCNGSYHAEILWSSEPKCKPHSVDKTYLCSISANVNCFVNRCDTRFCGTSD